jgi:ankyrin repeat protein
MSGSAVIGELWDAARTGDLDKVRDLVTGGLAIDSQNKFASTPLLYAAGAGHLEVVSWLLDQGADINYRTPRDFHTGGRFCALHQATAGGHLKVVQHLLQRGAKIDLKDGFGDTALTHSVEKGHKVIVEELLASGANPNISGQGGWCPILAAIYNKRIDIADLLERHGADVHLRRTDSDDTILMTACMNGDLVAVDWSLTRGVNVNFADKSGSTALIRAAMNGNSQIVRRLLSAGAEVNAKDSENWTALFYGVAGRNPEVVRALLEKGANPHDLGKNPLASAFPKDSKEWTPRDVAKRHPHPEVIQLLEQAMALTHSK